MAGVTTVAVSPGSAGVVVVWESPEQLVLFADPITAATFWAPAVKSRTANTVPGFESFWQFGTNTTVLIGGPYLIRNATIEGTTLALRGDLNASAPLTVVAPPEVKQVAWNGARVSVREDGALLTGQLTRSASVQEVRVPALTGWRFSDSLPEIQSGFDDSSWTVANKTTTNLIPKPLFGDGRVLYGTFTTQVDAISEKEADEPFRQGVITGCTFSRLLYAVYLVDVPQAAKTMFSSGATSTRPAPRLL